MSRKYTNKLYQMIEDGYPKDYVITACLKYMSEDDVKDMMEHNEMLEEDEEENED